MFQCLIFNTLVFSILMPRISMFNIPMVNGSNIPVFNAMKMKFNLKLTSHNNNMECNNIGQIVNMH